MNTLRDGNRKIYWVTLTHFKIIFQIDEQKHHNL